MYGSMPGTGMIVSLVNLMLIVVVHDAIEGGMPLFQEVGDNGIYNELMIRDMNVISIYMDMRPTMFLLCRPTCMLVLFIIHFD